MTVALAVTATGPGRISLDRAIGWDDELTGIAWASAVLGDRNRHLARHNHPRPRQRRPGRDPRLTATSVQTGFATSTNSQSSANRSASSRASACTPSRSVAWWPGRDEVDPELPRRLQRRLLGLARQEEVVALVRRFDQVVAGGAGRDRDSLDALRPMREHERLALHGALDPARELLDRRRARRASLRGRRLRTRSRARLRARAAS